MRALKFVTGLGLLLSLTVVAQAQDASKGTIKTIDTNRNEIVIKGIVKDTVYELTKDADIWLDGARSKLSELAADDRAVITYNKTGDRFIASSVRGLRKSKEATGTVKDVFTEKNEVTLKGTIKNTTYELMKDATVFVDGKRGALKDIREGDEVLVTYEQRGDRYMAHDVSIVKRR